MLLALLLAATLTWTDNSDGEHGFEVFYKGSDGVWTLVIATGPQLEPAPSTVTYVDKVSRPAGACYRVRAFHDSGLKSEFSNEACLPLTPKAPSTLEVKP